MTDQHFLLAHCPLCGSTKLIERVQSLVTLDEYEPPRDPAGSIVTYFYCDHCGHDWLTNRDDTTCPTGWQCCHVQCLLGKSVCLTCHEVRDTAALELEQRLYRKVMDDD